MVLHKAIPLVFAICTTFSSSIFADSLLSLPVNLPLPLNASDFTYDTQDPLVNRTRTPEILSYFGYPFDVFTATSQGYKLTLYRIPKGITAASANCTVREPVLLHHGLLSSSADFLSQDADRNLPLFLAENCFDVWLANARGTTYSRSHTTLDSSTDSAYWEFSFDEMGRYDLPAMIDTVLANSGTTEKRFTKLSYIGHSMGNTVFFICMHYNPEYNAKIRKYVSLSPAGYVGNMISPTIRTVALVPDPTAELAFQTLTKGQLGTDQFFGFMHKLYPILCSYQTVSDTFCSQYYYSIGGWSNQKLNKTVLSRLTSHFPETVSVRMISHFCQLIRSGKFESQARYFPSLDAGNNATNLTFDALVQPAVNEFYNANNASFLNKTLGLVTGTITNLLQTTTPASPMGTTQAPLLVTAPVAYNLNNTNIPTMVMVGAQDILTTPMDVNRTLAAIGPTVPKQLTILPNCNHIDIIIMDDSKARVSRPVRDYLASDMPTSIQ